MHRHGRHEKPGGQKKAPTKRGERYSDDSALEQELKPGRQGRRNWQHERRLFQQMDLENLTEYLLDQE